MIEILFQLLWLNARVLLPAGALGMLATALDLLCRCDPTGGFHGT